MRKLKPGKKKIRNPNRSHIEHMKILRTIDNLLSKVRTRRRSSYETERTVKHVVVFKH